MSAIFNPRNFFSEIHINKYNTSIALIAGIALAHILNLVIFYIILKNTFDQQTIVLYYTLATVPMYIIMMYSNYIFTASPQSSIDKFLECQKGTLYCEKCDKTKNSIGVGTSITGQRNK